VVRLFVSHYLIKVKTLKYQQQCLFASTLFVSTLSVAFAAGNPGPEVPSTTQTLEVSSAFTNASLQGQYAVFTIGQGGPYPQAGINIATYDGKGNFSGTTKQNLPGTPLGQRRVVIAPFEGTYTLNSDGSGRGIIQYRLPDGSNHQDVIALMITKTEKVGDKQQATEFFAMHEALGDESGGLLTLRGTKLPEGGRFTNASLKGNYAYTLIGQGGPIPQAGLGNMIYDGQGTFTGNATVNLPGATIGQRRFVSAPFVRPYTVNPDGTGTATPPGESDILFIITKAKVIKDIKVGEEVFFIVNQLNPLTGNLLTGYITKISD